MFPGSSYVIAEGISYDSEHGDLGKVYLPHLSRRELSLFLSLYLPLV